MLGRLDIGLVFESSVSLISLALPNPGHKPLGTLRAIINVIVLFRENEAADVHIAEV